MLYFEADEKNEKNKTNITSEVLDYYTNKLKLVKVSIIFAPSMLKVSECCVGVVSVSDPKVLRCIQNPV